MSSSQLTLIITEMFSEGNHDIGPVSLCNRDVEDKAQRGKKAFIDEHECLKWLNSKKPNSVLYICFGTVANFDASHLKEIAIALVISCNFT